MHLEERILRLEDGRSVHCRVWTPQAATSVDHGILLLHGVESHSQWFEEIAPALCAREIAVYAPDRPGWGASPGRRGHLESYDDAVGFVEELTSMIRLRHEHVHLGGLSWGGKLALYTAIRRPFLCESLILIAPGIEMRGRVPLGTRLRIAGSLLFGSGRAEVRLPIRDDDFTRRQDRNSYIRTDTYRIRETTASFCLESLKMDRFLEEQIARLRIPVCLLLAGDDVIVDSAAAEKLVSLAGSPRKAVHWHENAAHSLVFETPDRTATETADFVLEQNQDDEAGRVLVMGAGAVGSAVGGLLAWGGVETTLVGRARHAEAVNRHGLRLQMGKTTRMLQRHLSAVTAPGEATGKPDLVLLCVKGYDTAEAATAIRDTVPAGVPILSLQNGVDREAEIQGLCPEHPVLAGAICQYLHFEEAGSVRMAGDLGGIALGPLRPEDEPHAVRAEELLRHTGLKVHYAVDGRRVKWSKLMLNVAFNALNALTGLSSAELLARPRTGRLVVGALRECVEAMRLEGIAPLNLPGYPVARMASVIRAPAGIAQRLLAVAARRQAARYRGRSRTEIDEINGVVVRVLDAHQRPAPANRRLVELVASATADEAAHRELAANPDRIALGW
ncbi:MAG: 2-dehydropantoate 2-reductase [Planctomycetota bacterium]